VRAGAGPAAMGMSASLRRVVVVGAGRQGGVAAGILRAQGTEVVAFVDDDPALQGTRVHGAPVTGGACGLTDGALAGGVGAFVAIGNNAVRRRLAGQLRAAAIPLANAIHPSAVIMSPSVLGTGVLIAAGAIVVTGVVVEDDAVLNTGSSIDHDSRVRAGAYVSPGVRTAGLVDIGEDAFVGVGVTIGPGVVIGAGAIVGAGSVVLEDIPPRVLAFGCPARVQRPLVGPPDWSAILAGRAGRG